MAKKVQPPEPKYKKSKEFLAILKAHNRLVEDTADQYRHFNYAGQGMWSHPDPDEKLRRYDAYMAGMKKHEEMEKQCVESRQRIRDHEEFHKSVVRVLYAKGVYTKLQTMPAVIWNIRLSTSNKLVVNEKED